MENKSIKYYFELFGITKLYAIVNIIVFISMLPIIIIASLVPGIIFKIPLFLLFIFLAVNIVVFLFKLIRGFYRLSKRNSISN